MISLFYGLIITFIIFIIGLIGIVLHYNMIFILISIEIMLNAMALAFIMLGNYLGQISGFIMYLVIISIAAIDTSVNLSLILKAYRTYNITSIYDIH
ncbi:MAG: NADH-quinone oxidoreductase subunit NuoK [Candidatus Lightella neohaematopini]|nr:NADH-quinone oxidoreductase subunit NuoK [Candidatus Lightella neohaematopini]MCV2528672.1 NADH-quinone oxidoreductase subunit NuoK [Candidatus Lightella neohaematopini]